MELYGNTLVRPNTNNYLIKKSAQLIDVITNNEANHYCLPMLNFDSLKYKERDAIENIFKYWKNNSGFNISKMWDNRLRNYLGKRYDYRNNSFDWDLHMVLHYIEGGKRITSQEYIYWRNTGVAYTFLETDSTDPNYTFALVIARDGEKTVAVNYYGDILNGPFPSFGLDCEDEDMLKMGNMQPLKRSTDLTERNLTRLFYEIENQKPYIHKGKNDNIGIIITELPKIKIQENQLEIERAKVYSERYPSINVNDVEVKFITKTAMVDYPQLDRYKQFFDIIYCGHTYFEQMNPKIISMVKDNGTVLIESRKFIVNYKEEQHNAYKQKLLDLIKMSECRTMSEIDVIKNAVISYKIQRDK
ncbi:dynein axonemal assembly factor 3 homolog isoform X2 [Daktulosphaira vitifoliae]|nr:dynein axonemal assembly factor 3 homolog isoform X2 [Daktulosphaira vitifoliae]XP_050543807.1 dynein axonemal assembly factor 3 homolog isoform X2 [Daktulosphaira vitifoliae]XP_050543808.1 dynein axonemal assembly factor 3 homolog isoform X2 [Daktulosphaira vitifoliae]